jgi:antitoxin ParD1/3/4
MAATFSAPQGTEGHTEPGLQAGWQFCSDCAFLPPMRIDRIISARSTLMGHVDKRSITLTPDLADAIDGAVNAGEYASDNEAISDALREWKERRDNHGYTIAELRRLIQEGIDSGPGMDGPTFMAQMRERIEAKAKERKKANG